MKNITEAQQALVEKPLFATSVEREHPEMEMIYREFFREHAEWIERELERIAAYCRTRELPWQTLPYHSFGEEKKRALQPQSGQMSSKTLDLVDSDFKF